MNVNVLDIFEAGSVSTRYIHVRAHHVSTVLSVWMSALAPSNVSALKVNPARGVDLSQSLNSVPPLLLVT